MKRAAACLILLMSGVSFAGEGTTGAASLKLSAGARGQGIGDAYTAPANGSESLYWNPAGLALGPERSVIAGFQPMAEDISSNQLALSGRFGRFAIGAGYGSVSAASLDAFDTVGNKTGKFDAKDQTFTGAVAYGIPSFSVGVAGKMWRSDIDGVSADAAMADIGIAFQNPLFPKVRHGAVIRHIGGDVSYISQKDPLPMTAVFGTALRLGHALMLTGDYGHEKNAGGYAAGGLEWGFVTRETFSIALRGGYNTRRSDVGDLGGVAAGASLAWKAVAIDYAWVPFGDIGVSHAVSLRFQFEPSLRKFEAVVEPVLVPVAPVAPVKSKIVEPSPTPKRDRKPTRRRLTPLDSRTRR